MGYLVGRKGGKKGKGGKGKERRGLDSIFFFSFLFLLFLFFSNIHGRYITLHNITSHHNSRLLGHFQNGKERNGNGGVLFIIRICLRTLSLLDCFWYHFWVVGMDG